MTREIVTPETWGRYNRMCRGKVRHDSAAKARAHVEHLQAVNPGHTYNVYQCDYCTHFHVGHHWRSPRHAEHEAGMQSVR